MNAVDARALAVSRQQLLESYRQSCTLTSAATPDPTNHYRATGGGLVISVCRVSDHQVTRQTAAGVLVLADAMLFLPSLTTPPRIGTVTIAGDDRTFRINDARPSRDPSGNILEWRVYLGTQGAA